MQQFKVCVVGAGYWGKNHISTLDQIGVLGGIVDTSEKQLNFFSQKLPKVKCYKNVEDALQNSEFSGFTLATPAETHYELAKSIIISKKNLLIEKPFVSTIKEAENLISLSNKHSTKLMAGHLLLFHPAIQKIKQLINDGLIGNINYIYSNRLNFGKVRNFENAFESLGPHDISIFQYLLGLPPRSIVAHGGKFLKKDIHDTAIVNFTYPENIKGHIFVSWLHPFKEHRLVIVGSNGMIVFEDAMEGKPLKLYDKRFELKNGFHIGLGSEFRLIDYPDKKPLYEELKYFVNCLNGQNVDISNGAHALEVTKILTDVKKQLQNEAL